MDNKNYIEMVLALPEEFFKDWEWNVGDWAITSTGSEFLLITDPLIQQFGYPNRIEGMRFSKIKSYEILYMEDLRPVPSQKQLQSKMILEYIQPNGNKLSPYYLSMEFYFYLHDTVRGHFEERTLEEMWLEFLMLRVYNHEWYGEKWSVLP